MQERSSKAIFNFLASFEIGLCGGLDLVISVSDIALVMVCNDNVYVPLDTFVRATRSAFTFAILLWSIVQKLMLFCRIRNSFK